MKNLWCPIGPIPCGNNHQQALDVPALGMPARLDGGSTVTLNLHPAVERLLARIDRRVFSPGVGRIDVFAPTATVSWFF
jgi:hypothetical protein